MTLGQFVGGLTFQTRLTRRVGEVVAVTPTRGVLVRWLDGMSPDKYVHDTCEVDVYIPLPESGGAVN